MDGCVFDMGEKCFALTEKKCKGCKFCKTKEELKNGRDQATARLMTFDREVLNKIKAKYYSGQKTFVPNNG